MNTPILAMRVKAEDNVCKCPACSLEAFLSFTGIEHCPETVADAHDYATQLEDSPRVSRP